MTAAKTNERPGTRAVLRGFQMSATKARVVLNNIRGEDIQTAREILAATTREAADVIAKVLDSAIANAVNNDGMVAEELYVSACYADEGITMKRFTPRARGRAGAILKRACHITVIVSKMDDDRLEILSNARSARAQASRTSRVASSRRRADQTASLNKREAAAEAAALEAEANEAVTEDQMVSEVVNPEIATVASEVAAEEAIAEEAVAEVAVEETVAEEVAEEAAVTDEKKNEETN
jgi:large subunit ribosomal protein L22